MTKNLLALVGALAIVVLIGGAAYKTFAPAPVPFQQTLAKAVSQIPITQHFSQDLGPVGVLNCQVGVQPLTATMPSNVGLAITQIMRTNAVEIFVRVNGNVVRRWPLADYRASYAYLLTLNPPIIVPPNATLEIGQTPGACSNGPVNMGIAGYILNPSDFGQ